MILQFAARKVKIDEKVCQSRPNSTFKLSSFTFPFLVNLIKYLYPSLADCDNDSYVQNRLRYYVSGVWNQSEIALATI